MKRYSLQLCVISLAALSLASCSWLGGSWFGSDTPTPEIASTGSSGVISGCPNVAFIRDLSVYQHPAVADESNLVITARMGNLVSNCKKDDKGYVMADPMIQGGFDVVALRGANTAGTRAAMPFSISIVDESGNVVKKETYEIPIQFRQGSRELRLTVPMDVMKGLPTEQDPSRYQVLVGFQLSAEQLRANTAFFATTQGPVPQ